MVELANTSPAPHGLLEIAAYLVGEHQLWKDLGLLRIRALICCNIAPRPTEILRICQACSKDLTTNQLQNWCFLSIQYHVHIDIPIYIYRHHNDVLYMPKVSPLAYPCLNWRILWNLRTLSSLAIWIRNAQAATSHGATILPDEEAIHLTEMKAQPRRDVWRLWLMSEMHIAHSYEKMLRYAHIKIDGSTEIYLECIWVQVNKWMNK